MVAKTITTGFAVSGVITLALAISGCAISPSSSQRVIVPSVPAQWQTPSLASTSANAGGKVTANTGPQTNADSVWWKAFGDPKLEALVAEVLKENIDLAIAAIRVQSAMLSAELANNPRTPSMSANVGADVSKALSSGEETQSRRSSMTASVSYEVDLWGKLRNEREARAWQLTATEADRKALILAVIVSAATLHWQLAVQNEQIENAQDGITTASRTLEVVRSRFRAGYVAGVDVAQAESALLTQRTGLAVLVQQRGETRRALALLLNRPLSSALPTEIARLPDKVVPPVWPGLPAELLARRPDLQAAELRLRATLATQSAERAALYPSFALTSSLGTSSDSLVGILRNPSVALGAGLVLPLLQWKNTQLKLRVSEAQFEAAALGFKKQLYSALNEVEDALSARVQLVQEAGQLQGGLALAQRTERAAQARYLAGVTDVLPWLNAQQSVRGGQLAISQNRSAQLNNHVRLIKALGGEVDSPYSPQLQNDVPQTPRQ